MDGSFLVAGAARGQDVGAGRPGGPSAAQERPPVHLGRDGPTGPVEQDTPGPRTGTGDRLGGRTSRTGACMRSAVPLRAGGPAGGEGPGVHGGRGRTERAPGRHMGLVGARDARPSGTPAEVKRLRAHCASGCGVLGPV